jgi:hypothetical protein
MSLNTRSRLLKFAGVGVIAATALATAPMSMAATSGGVGINASAAQAKSARFTLGVSAKTVKPGQKITVSGLAYARAGENVTIMSRAISSTRTVAGVAAVQTPALVEGIYHTTVRISPSTKPGVYPVTLRYGNRQVASINNLKVIAATTTAKRTAFNYNVPVKATMLAKGSQVAVNGTVTWPQANVKDWWSASTINSTVQKGVNNAFQKPYSANGFNCVPTIKGEHTNFVCSLQGADVPTSVTFHYSIVYRGDTASG